jgi:hypothetical protein
MVSGENIRVDGRRAPVWKRDAPRVKYPGPFLFAACTFAPCVPFLFTCPFLHLLWS